MVELKTEHGTFTAADMKAAAKLAKEAERAERKRCQQAAVDGELARHRAMITGFRVYRAKMENQLHLCDMLPVGDKHCPLTVEPIDHFGYQTFRATYETEEGRATFEHYGSRPVAVALSVSGWTRAVALQDMESGKLTMHAVGICGAQVAFAPLPGVEAADFAPRPSTPAPF